MITYLIPCDVPVQPRRDALARALRDEHVARLHRIAEARRGRLLKYFQAKRAERAARERVQAWKAVQLPGAVA